MDKNQYLIKKEQEKRIGTNNEKCEWITVEQLQDKLKISRSTIYRWMRNGVIRAYRFNQSRNLYFLNDEIDQFLSMNPITPTGRLDKIGLTFLHTNIQL